MERNVERIEITISSRFENIELVQVIAEHLCEIPHISLLTPAMEKNLTRLDRRSMQGEMVGHRKK